MTLYSVASDENYTATHKRERLTVWSPPFASTWEGEAFSLPRGDGYMVRTYGGDRVRVSCMTPRTNSNFHIIDAAISDALNEHRRQREAVALHLPTD